MILVWKGAGILVAFIWFGSVLAGDWLARSVYGDTVSNGLSNLIGEWLAAVLTLGLALVLRLERVQRLDPVTGQIVEGRGEHSLFFIPVLAWPAIFFILGFVVYGAGKPAGPPLVQVTPRAAVQVKQVAAAKGASWNWYLRLEAYWPEEDSAPRYKFDIVSGRAKTGDNMSEAGGIRVVVPGSQVEMLRGAQVDFGEKDGEVGLFVNNPNFEGDSLEKWRPVLEGRRRIGGR